MFSVLKGTNELIDGDDLSIFKKFMDTSSSDGPFYVCKFCKTIHKGYYIDQGYNIDFRPSKIANLK